MEKPVRVVVVACGCADRLRHPGCAAFVPVGAGRAQAQADEADVTDAMTQEPQAPASPPQAWVHRCPHCGLVVNRDVNAAINIDRRGQRLRQQKEWR